MFEGWSPTALLVHAAALTYVIGLLIRDQIMLRALILLGTAFYIAYYYLNPATPLWDAILWSIVIGAANLFTMIRILSDRKPPILSDDDLVVFRAIPGIAPGDFRRLMAIAENLTVDEPYEMTVEGVQPDSLYFVPDGEITVGKRGQLARVGRGPMFIGEIAYLLGTGASATTQLRESERLFRWRTDALRALAARHDGVKVSLEAAFNRDLAAKVAAS